MIWQKLSPAIFTLFVFVLAQVVGSVLLFAAGLVALPDLSISYDHPAFPFILMVVNILAVLVCYFFLHYIRPVTSGDFASIRWRPGLLGIAGGVLGAMSISVLTDDLELPDMMKQLSLAMSHNGWGLLALTVVGPICEELLFREAIEGEMLRRGAAPWMAILVSALAFGIMHFNLAQGLYALPLGILLGIIYYKTGNIVLTALLHILNNSIAALQLYTMGESLEDISFAEWFGSPSAAYAFMALSGVLCVVLMKLFCHYYPSRQNISKKVVS